jgi:hypothetical protein
MTTHDIEKNVARNNILDRIMQGAAAFAFAAGTFLELLHHIKAVQPSNFILAGIVVTILFYMLIAPMFRG